MGSIRKNVEDTAKEWSAIVWRATTDGSSWALQRIKHILVSQMISGSTWNPNRRTMSRKCRQRALPLPLLASTIEGCDAACIAAGILEAVSNILMCRIHDAYKNLQFWEARAKGTEMQKVKFMILERGPLAFVHGVAKILRDCICESSATRSLVFTAVSQISTRTSLLSILQYRLAFVLGEVFKAAERFGDDINGGESMEVVSKALLSVHKAIFTLQGSYNLNKCNYNGGNEEASKTFLNVVLQFKEAPEELLEKKAWTDADVTFFAELIRDNLFQLDNCLTTVMQNYRKPRRATRYWLRYTGSAVGLALAAGWVVQHSRLMGSDDIDNWLKKGGEAVIAFTKEHVEEPLMSIRDDLFETFRRRHHGAAELEDVQLTADSLHRMLKAFTEQSKGQAIPDTATEQEMMEVVMSRYEKEITHPLQNLLGGELFRAMLIQVQKLKLDIETAMLELNQILRANEINFAILAALPAFVFAVILIWLLRISLLQSKGAEGRGKAAHLRRRMLLAKVERMVMTYQRFTENGQEELEMPYHYGMIVYFLDQFYRAVEGHAVISGEWSSLREDIIDLSKPKVGLSHKLLIIARIQRIYECVIPTRPSWRF